MIVVHIGRWCKGKKGKSEMSVGWKYVEGERGRGGVGEGS